MNVLKFICKCCKKEKFACEFSFSPAAKSGFKTECKECTCMKKRKNKKQPCKATKPETRWSSFTFGKSSVH